MSKWEFILEIVKQFTELGLFIALMICFYFSNKGGENDK